MIGESYPLPPHQPEPKSAYNCPKCQDTEIVSFWHDAGVYGAAISTEACACVKREEAL
jgi:hypothetical protein